MYQQYCQFLLKKEFYGLYPGKYICNSWRFTKAQSWDVYFNEEFQDCFIQVLFYLRMNIATAIGFIKDNFMNENGSFQGPDGMVLSNIW